MAGAFSGKGHDQSKNDTTTTTTDRDDIAAQITGGSGSGTLSSIIAGQGAAVGTGGAAPVISLSQSTLGIGFGETISNTYLAMHDSGAIQGGLTLANNALAVGFDLMQSMQAGVQASADSIVGAATQAMRDQTATSAAEVNKNIVTMGLLALAALTIWVWGVKS